MNKDLYIKNCIRTYSGKIVNVFEIDPDSIVIEDIAHALSFMPRFGGHLPKFYSVAQHSLTCMENVDKEFKLEALMHDASEAYLMDMPKPIKLNMPEYQKIEDNLQNVISKKFGITFPMSEEVKTIDKVMLELEWQCLMLEDEKLRIEKNIHQKTSEEIEKLFLEAFNFLTNKNG